MNKVNTDLNFKVHDGDEAQVVLSALLDVIPDHIDGCSPLAADFEVTIRLIKAEVK